jgi:hypothetical protein
MKNGYSAENYFLKAKRRGGENSTPNCKLE